MEPNERTRAIVWAWTTDERLAALERRVEILETAAKQPSLFDRPSPVFVPGPALKAAIPNDPEPKRRHASPLRESRKAAIRAGYRAAVQQALDANQPVPSVWQWASQHAVEFGCSASTLWVYARNARGVSK